MKANILIKIVVLSMLIPMGLQAQLGGLLKKPTAAGLLGDVTSGMDFFNVAAKHYSDALLPKEEAAKLKAEVDALQGKSDSKALSEISGKLQKAADEKLKAGKTLDAEAKKHVQDGQAAFTKGLAKWAGLAAALALAAKDGGQMPPWPQPFL